MSGYDETNPEEYRPTEPETAAGGAHSGVDSWSASSQASPATASSVSEGASVTEDHGGYADLSQAYTADASQPEPVLPQGANVQHGNETRMLPTEPPTSQLPAEPPTSQLPAEQSPPLRRGRRRRPATHPPSSPTRGSRRTSARPIRASRRRPVATRRSAPPPGSPSMRPRRPQALTAAPRGAGGGRAGSPWSPPYWSPPCWGPAVP